MTSLPIERWREVDTLFGQALERPADERTAFLRRACGSDPELYDEVKKLLDISAAAESFIGDSVQDFAARLLTDMGSGNGDMPDRLGPYRIIRELGRGGMGTVYLAERDDGQFKRTVAIKLVKRGMDTDEIIRRFRHERQILASLQHESIARLYGGGVSPDGRPYLVLEYVEGTPITRYCEDNSLSLDRRLDIFGDVCSAVQYAHQNLVVHRDLKPSNILVTDDGKVKLLDFGIAKLLSEGNGMLTRTGQQVLTPEYAAPEQISGEAITTATDVYGLGAILYEILVGLRPSLATEDDPGASGPRKPSGLASDRPYSKRLRGDLDTIVLKALRREPERRYKSAQALAEDITRHRRNRPVLARPDTVGYRLGKYLSRHRFGAAMVAASLLLVVGLTVVYTIQITQERNTARRERDKAEEVVAFLEKLFDASDPFAPQRLDTVSVRGFLQRGARQLDAELANQPLVRAQMQTVLGRVYNRLDLRAEAVPLLEEALQTRSSILGAGHPDVSESLTELADAMYSDGLYAEADSLSMLAIGSDRPTARRGTRALADALHINAMAQHALGRLDTAEVLFREVLDLRRELNGQPDPEVASALSTLAWVLSDLGHPAESEGLYRESVAMRREVYPDGHPSIAVGLNNLGVLLRDEGRYDEAEILLREALEINRAALGPDHEHVIDNLNVLASILRGQGRYEEAAPVYLEVLEARRRSLGPDHPRVSITLDGYAGLLKEMGEFVQAEKYELEAIAVAREAFGDEHFSIVITTGRLADIILAGGEPERALLHYQSAIALAERLFDPGHFRISSLKTRLGDCLTQMGRYEEAESNLVEAYEASSQSQGEDSRLAESARNYLVALYERWGKHEMAKPYRGAE